MSDNHIREAQQLFRFLQADRRSDIVSRDDYSSIERVARERPLLDGHDFDFPVEWAGASRQFHTFFKRWRQTNATKFPTSSDTTSSLPHPGTQSLEASATSDPSEFLAGRFERLHLGSEATARSSTLSREPFQSEVQYPVTPANKYQFRVTRGAPRIPRHHEAYRDQFGNLQLRDPEQVNVEPIPVQAEPHRVNAKPVPVNVEPVPVHGEPQPGHSEPQTVNVDKPHVEPRRRQITEMEPQRGSSSSEFQHEGVEEIPNTPRTGGRTGGQNDMYQVVMQLLQQQKAIQEQQNTTQAAMLQALQLITRGQPTQPAILPTAAAHQDAPVQSAPRLRPSDIGLFDPDVADEKGQGVIAEAKSSTTVYKCVLAFTQRLEDMAESHSEKAVKDNWIACLRGRALLWHSRHLRPAERQRLREASLETICKCLVEHFRESQSAVLDRIKKAKFTLQKYHNGESLTIFVNNLLQDARAYFNEEIAQIRTVHQAFDSQIQLVIPPPTDDMTVDQFLVQLRDRESTIRALARDKMITTATTPIKASEASTRASVASTKEGATAVTTRMVTKTGSSMDTSGHKARMMLGIGLVLMLTKLLCHLVT
ncbi:hypothetical protein E4U33_001218 [Claviceps sp. LM78 group G4]|nr:hypothetical protein E4U33_001218 [Claviceps sp. LM78 group G4]